MFFKSATNKKCPHASDIRLGKFTGYNTSSCEAQCAKNTQCVGFSIKTTSGPNQGDCMTCAATTGLEVHTDFIFYSKAKTPGAIGLIAESPVGPRIKLISLQTVLILPRNIMIFPQRPTFDMLDGLICADCIISLNTIDPL